MIGLGTLCSVAEITMLLNEISTEFDTNRTKTSQARKPFCELKNEARKTNSQTRRPDSKLREKTSRTESWVPLTVFGILNFKTVMKPHLTY